jgi:WD40 repeat protein
LPASDGNVLCGEAFSPDGQILATAYTDRIFLWDVASAARPRLLRTLAAPVTPVIQPPPFSPQDITSFQELVVPSAAVISWMASASAGLTLCPSSLCASATLLARARTKRR